MSLSGVCRSESGVDSGHDTTRTIDDKDLSKRNLIGQFEESAAKIQTERLKETAADWSQYYTLSTIMLVNTVQWKRALAK
ncbi:hypothetical protein HZH68_000979 [Vespula germanica]|uniref:Uncharacterized protein n=1 Tax=Vespula germanica TaxID=30212 RepID=A0A834NUW3_VESGE|nr:hypothetical protein HZH68_000979 [Vespula germanica]